MTQMVTIEGSVTPSAELPRGEQRTVVYSDRIDRLVKRGYIVIVKGPWDVDADEPAKYYQAEGTGEPNVGHELPADGQMHDISLPGAQPETPLEQVVPDVPQHPDESAQPTAPPPLSQFQVDSPEAVVDNNPKAPDTSESGDVGG